MEGIIYIRDNDWFKKEKIYKVGITTNLNNRNSSYKTGEPKQGQFIMVIKVPTNELHRIDLELKELLKPYHYNNDGDGGSEFYERKVFNEVEKNLKKICNNYKVLTSEEIVNEYGNKRSKIKPIKPISRNWFMVFNKKDPQKQQKNSWFSGLFKKKEPHKNSWFSGLFKKQH